MSSRPSTIPDLSGAARVVRRTVRALARRPLFTLTALLTLALGIGAATAILSVANAVLLRPLPYADADRLVVLLHDGQNPVAAANFLDWRREARSFGAMGAAEAWGPAVTGAGQPEKIRALRVTADVFPLLGVRPLMGRAFTAAEDRAGADRVAVIGHGLWQRRFGGDPDVIGRTVVLDGSAHVVVGVMPPGFQFAPFWVTRAELWAPLSLDARAADRDGQSLRVFARLVPGATLARARREVAAITARLEREAPGTNRNVAVVPLKEKVVGDVRPTILVLLGAVVCVLLIACANVSHLLLVRGAARRREMGVRAVLGATRARLAGELLAESVVLAVGGGIAGLGVGWLGVRALVAMGPRDLPRLDAVAVDGRVLAATLAVALLTGVACGLAPAVQVPAHDLGGGLRDGARGSTEGARQRRLRQLLIGSEFALALMLLVGAGLMMRTVGALQRVDPGFDPRHVLTATVPITGSPAAATPAARTAFYDDLLARVRALPGVRAAAAINHVPLAGDVWGTSFTAEGGVATGSAGAAGDDARSATYRVVTPGYFRTMGIALRDGRDVTDADRGGAPGVVIVNEALARRVWPDGAALGRRLALGGSDGAPEWRTVVGVVANAVRGDWSAAPAPELYVPYAQSPDYLTRPGAAFTYLTVVARTEGDPLALAGALRRTVGTLDPDIPVSDVQTMTAAVDAATARPRFLVLLLGAFAGAAVLLAAVGLYGVTSYAVSRRAQEIGVRIALGASRRDVVRLVVREGAGHAVAGTAAGAVAALALARGMRGLLFGVGAADPLTFVAVPLVLGAVVLAASWLPTRRAARVDPVVALRAE